MPAHVFYRTVKVDGLSIFYREAGPIDAPTILLLHGLPSSSRMYEPLLIRLADRYHLIAPDYPGFGHSDWPDPRQFAYTFDRVAPDLCTDEFAFLNQPGQAEIQSDLFYDYRTNVDSYPKWQAWLREKQPRLLVIWGRYELSFDPSEPEAYRRDVPNAEVHIVDGGHFALDTAADEIAEFVRNFLK